MYILKSWANPTDEGLTHQCPLLWTWVLEKEGALETSIVQKTSTQGTRTFTQVQASQRSLLLLVCLWNYRRNRGLQCFADAIWRGLWKLGLRVSSSPPSPSLYIDRPGLGQPVESVTNQVFPFKLSIFRLLLVFQAIGRQWVTQSLHQAVATPWAFTVSGSYRPNSSTCRVYPCQVESYHEQRSYHVGCLALCKCPPSRQISMYPLV